MDRTSQKSTPMPAITIAAIEPTTTTTDIFDFGFALLVELGASNAFPNPSFFQHETIRALYQESDRFGESADPCADGSRARTPQKPRYGLRAPGWREAKRSDPACQRC